MAGLAAWLAMATAGMAWGAEEAKPLKLTTTADHSKFKELQREFKTGPELTRACLSCHTEAAGQIHRGRGLGLSVCTDTPSDCPAPGSIASTEASYVTGQLIVADGGNSIVEDHNA